MILAVHAGRASPAQVDELGHMNFLEYQREADVATMAAWRALNGGREARDRAGLEFVTVETLVRYVGELREGEAFEVRAQLLAFDDKRFILRDDILAADGALACSVEVLGLGFDLNTRRAVAFTPEVRAALARSLAEDALAPRLALRPPSRERR